MLFRFPFRTKDVDTSLAGSANFARFSKVIGAVRGVSCSGRCRKALHVSTGGRSADQAFRQSLDRGDFRALAAKCGRHRFGHAGALRLGRRVILFISSRDAAPRQIRARPGRAAQQLAVLASTDGLTGSMNRRAFDAELERVYRSAIRTGASLAVLMIDADQFKRFNDTYGHPAGDGVLRAVATTMRAISAGPAT